jgi:hypothetical protein
MIDSPASLPTDLVVVELDPEGKVSGSITQAFTVAAL